jgi:small ligand-binding sensory domain FIST
MAHDHDTGHRTSPVGKPAASITARASVVATADWKLAVDLVEADLIDHTGAEPPPDLLIVFINDAWRQHYAAILHDLRRRTGVGTIVGGSASGVLADGHEFESTPGISCLALWLPGVTVTPVRLHQETLPLLDEPEAWHTSTGVDPARLRGIVLLADPYRMDANALVCGLGGCYPGIPIVGGMTSASEHRRQTWVFLDEHVYDEGGVALMLEGPVRLAVVVSHGAEPVGEPWTITKVDRNTILEIGHRPALDLFLDTARAVYGDTAEREFPFGEWLIGFAAHEYQDRFHRGDFVVRGILGGDPERKGLVVGGMPRAGQTVQFQLRDPALADVELRQHLVDVRAGTAGASAAAGLLFTCNGRGEEMFGAPHHDAEVVNTLLPRIPVAGMFCNGEVGPAGPRGIPTLHGFTATLGLIVPDVP